MEPEIKTQTNEWVIVPMHCQYTWTIPKNHRYKGRLELLLNESGIRPSGSLLKALRRSHQSQIDKILNKMR